MTDQPEAELLPLAVSSPAYGAPGDPQAFLDADARAGVTVDGKPSFTVDQAAAQLNRAGLSWSASLGEPATVTYAFRGVASSSLPESVSGFQQFGVTQIAAAELSLRAWSDVADINFVRVGYGTSGYQAYSDNATILFSGYTSGADGAAAFTYLPGDPAASSLTGDVFVNLTLSYDVNPVAGEYGQQVLTHEIGHAIGLSHPSDYDAGDMGAADITYAANASYYEDSRQYSIMSYFASSSTGASASIFAAAPQLDDIAAAQRMYGANMATRAGDTVYGFGDTTGEPWYHLVDASSHIYAAIWDGGGADTLNFGLFTQDQVIDLHEGSFSNVGGDIGNVAIAVGAKIENAVAGSGADVLIGNALNNLLQGGAGADTLVASAGVDTLDGGAGLDTVSFVGLSKGYAASLSSVSGGPEHGVDTLISVETLAFADGALTADPTSVAAQVSRIYDTLGRPANAGELESGEQVLLHGGDPATLAQSLIASPEFAARLGNDGSDAHFVTVLYETLLHREPTSSDLALQTSGLQSGLSRAQLVVNLAGSPEHQLDASATLAAGLWQADDRIDGLVLFYDAAFARLPDAAGEGGFLSQLAAGATLRGLASAFTGSPEFDLHVPTGATDTQFVDALYQQVLHRTADAAGEQLFAGLIGSGVSRADVFYDFAISSEHELNVLSHSAVGVG